MRHGYFIGELGLFDTSVGQELRHFNMTEGGLQGDFFPYSYYVFFFL